MNYLAHLYLADDDIESLLGNLMGDFVKGRLDQTTGLDLSAGLLRGIQQHRKIDSFTDQHAIFKRSRARLPPALRRYAGVLVDIFYDHFLAKNWTCYSPISLPDFSRSVYVVLENHYHLLPTTMQRSVKHMTANDLLVSYQSTGGIEKALRGLEQRLRKPYPLHHGRHTLEQHYTALNADFTEFFPQLIAFVERYKATQQELEHALSHPRNNPP